MFVRTQIPLKNWLFVKFNRECRETGTAFDREELPDRTAIDVLTGLISIGQLANKEETVFKTEQMVSPNDDKQELLSGLSEERAREIDCDIMGIRYRVYIPTPNGNYAMMEFADPKKLLKETEWPDK